MNKFLHTIKNLYPFLVGILLIFFLFLEISSISTESQTMDEGVHLTAGYTYLKTGDYRLNAEHPPLIKILSALPLLVSNPSLPLSAPSWLNADEWIFANEFIYNTDHNGLTADQLFFLGRLPIIFLSIIFGITIAYITKKYSPHKYSYLASLLALFLYCFSPLIIAHSRYVTTDLGISLSYLLTVYFLGKYLKSPVLKNLLLFSLFFAISQVVKFSAWFLLPIFCILYFLAHYYFSKKLGWKKFIFALFVMLVISSVVIFISYGFELKAPNSDPWFQSFYTTKGEITPEQISQLPPLAQSLSKLYLTYPQLVDKIVSTPLPFYSYLKGVYLLYNHDFWGHTSYLLGDHAKYGWWYYFPLAFLVKTTLSVIILLVITTVSLIFNFFRKYKNLDNKQKVLIIVPFNYFLLTIPPLVYLLISMNSHLNLGIRHIILIYPFIFIIIGITLARELLISKKIFSLLIAFLLFFHAISSLRIYPNYLSYFNELAGGPSNGHLYLTDSNLDWGQDFLKLKNYLALNNIEKINLQYFGQADPDYYQLIYSPIETNEDLLMKKTPPRGYYAISISDLLSEDKKYIWLLTKKPMASFGYSILLFNLD